LSGGGAEIAVKAGSLLPTGLKSELGRWYCLVVLTAPPSYPVSNFGTIPSPIRIDCGRFRSNHYKETVAELTETCPNQGVLNYKKLTENCPK
jgi:hypothetical protein